MTLKTVLAAGAAALALATVSGAAAQEVTGALHGQITAADGRPVAGGSVVVTHAPTGTSVTAKTNAQGFFSAAGLRPGGPYVVSVTAPGFQPQKAQVPNVGLGGAEEVDLALKPEGSVAELVVTAKATPKAFEAGPSTDFNATQIDTLPTSTRDLKDIARIDPFASVDASNSDALSFAGINTRFNQLTIDGIRQNDDFGLNNNGYPTQRSPISLEVLQAIQVSVAPYSVLNNGFLGGSINATTKSGTNQFHGSAYGEYTSDALRGDSIRGLPINSPFEEKTWGVTLGGPIWKDHLFFFGGYEKYDETFSLDEGPTGSGKSTIIPRISVDAVNALRDATKSIYNYDPGSWVDGAPPVSDEKVFAKIDWNITDRHRLFVAYQRTVGNSFNGSATNAFTSGDSVTTPAVGLMTRQYDKNEVLRALSLQENSQWTDRLSTELRLSQKETETTQLPVGAGLDVGTVAVKVADEPGVAAGTGSPEIRFGPDNFRHDNYLDVKTKTAEALARYHAGAHDFTVGGRIEHDDIFNVFVAKSLGDWTFDSYADFLNRTASRFSLTGAVDPNGGTVPATLGTARQGAAAFSYNLYSVYGEDSWQIRPDVNILFGLRYDWFSQQDAPSLNQNFVSRNGFANNANLDGKGILLPRVGFTWKASDRIDVSGGVGRFSSQGLNVWISDPFANDGVRQTNAVCPAGPYTNVDLKVAPQGCTFTPGSGDTNALDPDLKIPSVWKASLSGGYDFGDGLRAQVDLLYAAFRDSLIWKDLRSTQVGTAPDGRPIYGRTTNGVIGANTYDLLLTNAGDGGTSKSVAFTLQKAWTEGVFDGLTLRGSYTYTRATDRNPMTSSIALSSYTRFATADPNNPGAATSDYEVRYRAAVEASWFHRFFGDYRTGVTVFAQRRAGLPFSYTFANTNRTGSSEYDDVFGNVVSSYSGRQASSNQLFYVPAMSGDQVTLTSDPKVTYAPGFDLAAFNAFLKQSGLVKYAGSIAPRNAFRGHAVTTIDLRISQELPAFVPHGSRVTAYVDIKNLGNLINDKWGVLDQYDFYRGVPVVQPKIVNGQYVYSGAVSAPKPFVVTAASLWTVKFGLKYSF
jgi:outer membrane receptor for ferrienterochelin and colicin